MIAAPASRALRAGREFDAELLRFTASVDTGRGFRIALDRSPSFFDALEVEGDDAAVAAFVVPGGEGMPDRIVGTGVMTARPVHINGSALPEPVGQLGSARVDPRHRGGTVVARCMKLLHEWHVERPARVFLTTILEDNATARALFESGRGSLPSYVDHGRLVTLNSPVGPGRVRGRPPSADIEVTEGEPGEEPRIVAFWNAWGRRRQFFPAYDRRHLQARNGLLRGLSVRDILLARARRGGEILGTLGLWDQRPFRRWVVRGLPRGLRWGAPLFDLTAWMTGGLRLPKPNETLAQRFGACTCVAGDDPALMSALLDAARTRLARAGGGWLTLGLHERDPLLPTARTLRARELHSRLYLVHWPEGRHVAEAIDPERCPYVEIGGI